MQETTEADLLNRVLIILGFLVMVGLVAADETGFKVALWILAGLFAAILAINLVKGKTCRCCLRTAVQTETLPPLHRVKYAHKILARLRPFIVAAQGSEISPPPVTETPASPNLAPTIPPPDFGSQAP